jgi:hypothetical protein
MRTTLALILTALLLAACATASTETPPLPTLASVGQPDSAQPNATPAPDSAAQPDGAATPDGMAQAGPMTPAPGQPGADGAQPTVDIEQVIGMLPPPGTIIAPATEEVMAAQLPFSTIVYEETGGPANASLTVEIFSDGRVLRNGTETRVGPEVIAELDQLLRDIRFFGINGQFTMPGAGSEVYNYAVTVQLEDGSARRLDAQDRVTPPELLRLFSRLRVVGG